MAVVGEARLGVRAGEPVGVVVLDLVVVPDRHEVVGGVHRLQVGVALVEVVLLPVLGQVLDVSVVVEAGGVLARAGVVMGLVDVVAEVEDEVDVRLLGDRGVGVVEAGLVALAGEERDPQRMLGVMRRSSPEAADRGPLVLGVEAVEVLVRRLEAADPGARGEVALLARGDGLLQDDVLEVAVLGDLELEPRGVLGLTQLRPQDRALGVGEAGGDAEREGAGLGDGYAPLAGDRRVVREGGDRRTRGETGDQELATAQARLRVERLQIEASILELLQVHTSFSSHSPLL